jgi:hypothetical protein
VNKEKKMITKPTDIDYEFENRINLRICRECYELYGPISLGGGATVRQRCKCDKVIDEIWCNYLSNKAYDTCYCCGLRIIKTGWWRASYFCYHCGFKTSWWARVAQQNRQALEEFKNEHNRTANLEHNYGKIILKKQVDLVGLPGDGSVLDFIELINNLGDIYPLQEDAFFGWLAHRTGRTIDEVKIFYREHKC